MYMYMYLYLYMYTVYICKCKCIFICLCLCICMGLVNQLLITLTVGALCIDIGKERQYLLSSVRSETYLSG